MKVIVRAAVEDDIDRLFAWIAKDNSSAATEMASRIRHGPVAGLVGIEGGVVSGVINLESPDVSASGRRPRHENRYHDA
jgi:hypothetical protein